MRRPDVVATTRGAPRIPHGALAAHPAPGREDLQPIGLHDIIAIDKRIFVKLNEICEDGIRPVGQNLPRDEAIETVLNDTEINAMTTMRIGGSGAKLRVGIGDGLDWKHG